MDADRLTSALTNLPFVLSSSPTARREDGATHSMRDLAYFIGTFAVALLLGIGSAWYMIEYGSPLTTTKVGPWASWDSEGKPDADPYTRAHVARTDSNGHALSSSCEYTIEGSPLNARWWSIAVYDEYGGLIDNPTSRYSFNSEELLRHSDGTFRINLASTARPENWLPSGTDGRTLILMLRIYNPRETDSLGIGLIPRERLPKIERKSCE